MGSSAIGGPDLNTHIIITDLAADFDFHRQGPTMPDGGMTWQDLFNDHARRPASSRQGNSKRATLCGKLWGRRFRKDMLQAVALQTSIQSDHGTMIDRVIASTRARSWTA